MADLRLAFGPVPSRRLGRSLGINNIPPKACSYSCVYCQLGRTRPMRTRRSAFHEPEMVAAAVRAQVERARSAGEPIDYLAFVPDGEPALDAGLGREIRLLKQLAIPIAVISNNSLTWMPEVRADLAAADWVSLKVDAVDEATWRAVDRPSRRLRLDSVLEGAVRFAGEYGGVLVTETMLVSGVNDGELQLRALAHFLRRLHSRVAYVSVPTRPPAEAWAHAPDEGTLTRACEAIGAEVERVELLAGYEGDDFAFTGDVEADLLSIAAVHPMRREAVLALLARADADLSVIDRLVASGRLIQTEGGGRTYYVRRFR